MMGISVERILKSKFCIGQPEFAVGNRSNGGQGESAWEPMKEDVEVVIGKVDGFIQIESVGATGWP